MNPTTAEIGSRIRALQIELDQVIYYDGEDDIEAANIRDEITRLASL